jgi:hypothetical protein
MRHVVFSSLLVISLCSACVTVRSVNPDPYVALGEQPVDATWTLSNVAVLAPTNPDLSNHRFTTMLQQLEGHLRTALISEAALGTYDHNARNSQYAVEVELRLIEGESFNGYQAVSLAGSVVGPVSGAFIGSSLGGLASPIGTLIGAAVGGGASLLTSAFTPNITHSGQLEATVTVRRARDGTEVSRRTSRGEWSAELNAFDVETKLATAAGQALPELEREIARSLRATFIVLPAQNLLSAADPEPPVHAMP